MRTLLTTIPLHGHFRPIVPLAEALVDAGHTVGVATAASFEGVGAVGGLEHVPAGISAAEAIEQTVARHPDFAGASGEERSRRVIPDLFVGSYARALLTDAGRLLAWQPDVVIREEGEFAGPVVAALARVPCAEHGWGPMRPPEQVEAAAQALAPLWKQAGLEPAASDGTDESFYLDPCPPSLQFRYAEDVARRRLIRPGIPASSSREPPPWVRELGDRVVYVTLGTVASFASDTDFLEATIAAIRNEDVEVVVTVGPDGDPSVLGDQPPNVHVTRFVPQAEVLAHSVLAVTNGGSGSMLGALAAGVPLLIVPGPVSPSQARNAQAVCSVGAGRTLARRNATAGRLNCEIRPLLQDASYRAAAERTRDEIIAMPSASQAVSSIERLAFAGRP